MNIEKHNFDEECNIDQLEPLATLGDFYSCTDIDPLLSELETMRTENANLKLHKEYDQTLDQLIIERDRLLLENESLDDKLQEQLCTVGSLLEENAKLIAERDELIHDRDMLKMCADHYEDELKRMHAERKAMMKQEPVAWNRYDSDKFVGTVYKLPGGMYTPHIRYEPLFLHPLPAQQIEQKHGSWHTYLPIITDGIVDILGTDPVVLIEKDESTTSGYTWTQDAVDFCCIIPVNEPPQQIPEGYDLEWHDNHLIVTAPDNGQGLAYADETLYQFIKAMLSASQPKGELI